MNPIEYFVNNFYNLSGVTVAEKEKNFRSLVHKNIALLQDQNSNEIIMSRVTPRSNLEKSFKIDLLLSCHRMGDLMAIFTSGDEASISRIIRHGWFFQKALQHMTAQEITDSLLPQLSYSIRMKVLKKMSIHLNDEDKLHDIFLAVKNRYGLKVAMPVLLGCSEDKLEFIIRNNLIFFTPAQLKLFIKKTPKLLPMYLEEYVKHKGNSKLLLKNDLLRYIASTDYSVYITIQDKYGTGVVHGKKMSKKVFDKEKEKILINPQKYDYMFRKSVFFRRLGVCGSFKTYFQTFFPKKLEDFNYTKYCTVHDRLKFCPKLKQFQILDDTFKNIYHIQIDDCPNKMVKMILDMIPNPKRRSQAAQKIMEINDDIEYVVYLETSQSIPYIKKEMDLATNKVSRRKELIRALVKTCKINDDSNALKKVLEYSLVRHRNDIDAIDSFFSGLMNNYDYHSFDKDIWKLINELIAIYKMKEGNIGSLTDLLLTSAEMLFNNNEPFEEPILESMKSSYSPYEHIFSHTCTNYKFIRAALLKAIDFLPKLFDEKRLQICYCNLATRLMSWNKNHPEFAIHLSDYPIFFESLKKQGERSVYYDITSLVCTKDRSNEVMEIVEHQWDKHLTCYKNIFFYYLKWYPSIFNNHLNSSVEALINDYSDHNKIINIIRRYEHIQLPQTIIKFVQGELDESQKCDENKMEVDDRHEYKDEKAIENKFRTLARLMNSEDYINYVAKYKPKSLSVDMKNDDEKDLYQTQCHIVTNFKYLSPLFVVPQVLEYCGGDFLKWALSPLYKSFYRIPENKIHLHLNRLMKNSVSVRKHAVFLAFQLLDINSIKNILKTVLGTEKNTSLRKRFMETSLKLFQQNESDEVWDIFKCSLSLIDETDKESYEKLADVSYIPINYIIRYFEEVWLLIEQSNILAMHKYDFKNKLVCKMSPYVKQLSSEFCLKIIKSLFFQFSDIFSYDRMSISTFICEYLLHHQDPERFIEIYKILQANKNSCSGNPKLSTQVCLEVRMFIYKFCKYITSSGKFCIWEQPHTENFLNQLSTMYLDVEFFDEYVLILNVLILIKLEKKNVETYASELTIFNQRMFETYGPYVTDFLESIIVDSLKYFRQPNGNSVNIKFIKELLKNNDSEFTFKIALNILQFCNSHCAEYKTLKDIFESCQHRYVQIILRQKSLFSEIA